MEMSCGGACVINCLYLRFNIVNLWKTEYGPQHFRLLGKIILYVYGQYDKE